MTRKTTGSLGDKTVKGSEQKEVKRRPRRVPVDEYGVLHVRNEFKEPGYVYRWVNDQGGRIPFLKDIGYEFVIDPSKTACKDIIKLEGTIPGSAVVKSVGKSKELYAYLMRIPQEYYDEDMERKRQERMDLDKAQPKEEGIFVQKDSDE